MAYCEHTVPDYHRVLKYSRVKVTNMETMTPQPPTPCVVLEWCALCCDFVS